jgi:beta-barrel assembly-enhancing protease
MRRLLFIIVIGLCGVLSLAFGFNKTEQGIGVNFAPLFQSAGTVTQTTDRLLSKAIPVSALDEAALGEELSERYKVYCDTFSTAHTYLNVMIEKLAQQSAKKPFRYRVFVEQYDYPNAYALPGGVIVVFRGLLDTLHSESELASVLAHEMGHIELGHCFQSVKYELLTRKIQSEELGRIADITNQLLLRHSFSKTQENEADEYGYQLMLESQYDPRGMGLAFRRLQGDDTTRTRRRNVFNDYFSSHPDLTQRVKKFSEQAGTWWKKNEGERRYVGKENLRSYYSMFEVPMDSEWVSK